MSDIWKVFSKAELQNLIGTPTLSRLEHLLPALAPSIEPDSIYYKDTLCKIFDSFAGIDALTRQEFRYDFLNHLTPTQIDSIISWTKVNAEGLSFLEKITKLASKSWKDETYSRAFLGAVGLPDSLLPTQGAETPETQLLPAPDVPLKQLKDYQFNVYIEAASRLSAANARFVVQMPTGSGKTRTAMELVASFLNDAPEGAFVIWLAHSEELCDQAYEAFMEVWRHLGQHVVRVTRCWGPGAKLSSIFKERSFVIGGFQKMYSLLSDSEGEFTEIRKRTALIIVDEAHKVLAPTYKEVTKALIGDGARVVGLTATPGRSVIDTEQNKALAEFFFNEIVTIDSGTESVIQHLRKRKVLAEVTFEPLYSRLNYELGVADRRYLEKFFDLPPGILKAIGSDDIRNIEILKRLQHECEGGRQVIFFACSVEHSRFIAAMLAYLGFRAAHIDGATSRVRRRALIEEFRNREIQVICNFGVLSTGFDAPKTDLIFISRPTASIVLYSQMIGRGLRGPAIGGTPNCKVIDVKDNIVGFSNEEAVYGYFEEYFQPSV